MTPADFPGLQPEVFDVAYSSAGMWIARDDTDSPILRYNTSGVLTGYVMGTTVPSAAGLAVDPEGYLWVSDPENDKIYKLDTSTSIGESSGIPLDGVSVYPVTNPFTSVGMIGTTGYEEYARVEVFDLNGRVLHTGMINNSSFSWEASEDPNGAYVVRVWDTENTSTLRLIKI